MADPALLHSTLKRPTCRNDWEEQKAHIRKLWWDDDEPLERVMSFMEKYHHFQATAKQYKTVLKEWNLLKYVPTNEMKAIVKSKPPSQATSKGNRVHGEGSGGPAEQDRSVRKENHGYYEAISVCPQSHVSYPMRGILYHTVAIAPTPVPSGYLEVFHQLARVYPGELAQVRRRMVV
ncbi:hypothetical protein PG995_010205 [Apiospora arundinis]|uniref:Ankyrin repeat-containing domain protein n=1 Tax=Apiospora arundinis TaxID=335852 RepID=A0ABR2ISW8_9PEZI